MTTERTPDEVGNAWERATRTILGRVVTRRRLVGEIVSITTGVGFGLWARPLLDRFLLALQLQQPSEQNSPEQPKPKREIFGFLRLNQVEYLDIKPEYIDFRALTTLACFDVPMSGDGNLNTGAFDEDLKNPMVDQILRKAREQDTKVVLTISQLDNEIWDEKRERTIPFEESPIKKLLDSPEAQDRAIVQIVEVVKAGKFDGVNMDLEYGQDPGAIHRNRFTKFIAKLTQKLHQEVQGSQVSAAIYTRAGIDSMIYDAKNLAGACDQLLLMAYVYDEANFATPTAPLYRPGEWSINYALKAVLEQMPAWQLTVVYPAFGPRYQVEKPYIGAPAIRDSIYYTFAQQQRLLRINPTTLQGWDDDARTEWAAWPLGANLWEMSIVGGVRSLQEWLDFVGQTEGLGLGIWTLDDYAYDDPDPEFWELILQKFHQDLAKKSADTWTAPESRKITNVVTYSQADEQWLKQAQAEQVMVLSGETTVATILSTLTDNKINPVQVAKLFKERGLRDSKQGLLMRNGGNDVLTWLAREYGLQVNKVLDRNRPYVTEVEQNAPFDYKEAERLLSKEGLIIASTKDTILIIRDVDSEQKTMTIIDPKDGQIKIVNESDLGVLAYAYAVRAQK